MGTPEQELSDALRDFVGAIQALDKGEVTIATASALTRAEARIRALFAARDCGHPERHCPVCDGSVEQCREFCRNAASV